MSVTIERGSAFLTERYSFDLGACSIEKGYAQIDTKQDASYFGQWANPFTRTIVSYCEGDVTRTVCDTDAEFVDELRNLQSWTDGAGYGPLKIDPGESRPEIAERFVELGLRDLLH